jgi:hypothetical protein
VIGDKYEVKGVPVKYDDVIIGRANLTDDGKSINIEITAPGTHSYLKELFLLMFAESISIKPDLIELFQAEPNIFNTGPHVGHLRSI